MTLLEASHLCVRYGRLTIVDDVRFSLGEGQWLMLIGPNGAGKSTIVNAISQGVAYEGCIRYRGQDVKAFRPHQLAKRIGVLAQAHAADYSFTVGELVRLGRYAYAPRFLSRRSDEDERRVLDALERTGLTAQQGQSICTLSGGELQRAFLAQLLAQNPSVLILDEPSNHLDLVYQKRTFELLGDWLKCEGRAIVSVVHDLSLARAYGSHALLLDRGRTVASGAIDAVFSPKHLESAYDLDVYGWMRGLLMRWQSEPVSK